MIHNKKQLVSIALVCTIASSAFSAWWGRSEDDNKEPFTAMAIPQAADAWLVDGPEAKYVDLSEGASGQGIRLTFKEAYRQEFDRDTYGYNFKRITTLKLKKPVALEPGARRLGMWLYAKDWYDYDTSWIRYILEDADGIQYLYTSQHNSGEGPRWNWMESRDFTSGELGRLDESMVLVEGGLQHRMPVEPLSLVGFEIDVSTVHWNRGDSFIELGTVYADGIAREDSTFYWHTEKRFLFGEMPFAKLPFVMAGDLVSGPGTYEIAWSLRAGKYERPVRQGSWTLEQYSHSITDQARRLEFPIQAEGQYWVTYTIQSKQADGRTGKSVDKTGILQIVRGTDAAPAPIAADSRPVGGKLLVLNPDRAASIYQPGELTDCIMRVWKPEAGVPADPVTLKARWTAYPAKKDHDYRDFEIEPVASHDIAVMFTAEADYADVEIPLTLTDEMPLLKLDSGLFAGARKLDSFSTWVGRQTAPRIEPWTRRDEVATFEEIFEDGNHLFTTGEWGGKWGEIINPVWFEDWVKDVKKQNVTAIELFPDWMPLEPMPGVFYWEELDRRIDVIAKHGMKTMIMLNPSMHPDWLPAESQASQEGMVSGLWHGGNNAFKTPASETLWTHFSEFTKQVALRYRNNPNVVAYSCHSLFFDHFWADHPWRGQYVDYSEPFKRGFRRYLRDVRNLSLDDLGMRWGQPLESWDAVQLPRPRGFEGMPIDQPDPRQSWRDFLAYRRWIQQAFFTQMIIGTIRKYDDVRPVGTHGLQAPVEWYKANDCFVCSGSSEGSIAKYRKGHQAFPPGIPVRIESIGMNFPSAQYANMSVANILAQGNVHIQSFWKMGARLDSGWAGEGPIGEGQRAIAQWQKMLQGELGTAEPIHLRQAEADPVLGLLFSHASILHGASTFHFHRLDDYKWILERAVNAPAETIYEDVSAEALAKFPCVVVDITSWVLPKATIERLVEYVHNGGKLVISPTSGKYTEDPELDGRYVLYKSLGLPLPSSEWNTAEEYRQEGDYRPHRGWPFGITGKGTPGEQSLSEPGQTALATTVDNDIFDRGQQLVFRLGAYTMYNRDTWSDWAHMVPRFLYGRHKEKAIEAGDVVATWTDGGPAATLHNVGDGQVLAMWGSPDWYNWKPALEAITDWARGEAETMAAEQAQEPFEIPTENFDGFLLRQGDIRWAVIRNEQTGWTRIYGNWEKQKEAERTHGVIRILDHLPAERYRVRDLTPEIGSDFDQVMTAAELAAPGIGTDLIPSETRIYRLDPVK